MTRIKQMFADKKHYKLSDDPHNPPHPRPLTIN